MMHDIDKEIENAHQRLVATTKKLDQLKQDFLTLVVDYMREWYPEKTEYVVANEPELTQSLPTGELSKLKTEMYGLVAKVDALVIEFLDDKKYWWHLREDPSKYSRHSVETKSILKRIETQLRYVAGLLGPILEKYGYLSQHPWRESPPARNNQYFHDTPYFPYGLDISKPMKDMLITYSTHCNEVLDGTRELAELKSRKEIEQAKDAWKRA